MVESGTSVLFQILITSLSWEKKIWQDGEFGGNKFGRRAWIKHFRHGKETRRLRKKRDPKTEVREPHTKVFALLCVD